MSKRKTAAEKKLAEAKGFGFKYHPWMAGLEDDIKAKIVNLWLRAFYSGRNWRDGGFEAGDYQDYDDFD